MSTFIIAVPTFKLQLKFAKWLNDFKQQYLFRYILNYTYFCIKIHTYIYTHIYLLIEQQNIAKQVAIKQPYTTYLVALLLSLLLSSYIRAYVPQSVSVSAIFQSIQMQIRRLFAEPVMAVGGGRVGGGGHWLWVVVATRSVVLFATINLCGALWL